MDFIFNGMNELSRGVIVTFYIHLHLTKLLWQYLDIELEEGETFVWAMGKRQEMMRGLKFWQGQQEPGSEHTFQAHFYFFGIFSSFLSLTLSLFLKAL